MRHEGQSWDIAGRRGGAGDNLPFSALYLDQDKGSRYRYMLWPVNWRYLMNFGHLFVLNFPLVHNCRFVSLGQHLLSILWSINYSDRKGKWWQRTKLSPHLTKRPNFKINVLCFRETKLIPVVGWGSALSPEIKFWGLLNLMFLHINTLPMSKVCLLQSIIIGNF